MEKQKKQKLSIQKNVNYLTENTLESVYKKKFEKISLLQDDKEYNNFLNQKELLNRKNISESETEFDNLYPSLDDPNFSIKIAEKKEFNDNKYDGTLYDIEEHASKMSEIDFDLDPHQIFVKNFLSFQTPYNSLLLYHGLGSGKTCSAISVSEEMRTYLSQLGFTQRIIVVASPNVQDNFKLQLFDDRKLKLVDGLWNLKACTGNKYIKEINPMNMKGLSKEKVIKQVQRIINNSYLFVGYTEFANYIVKISHTEDNNKNIMISKLKKHFNNRLIIIDEVHNIRITEDSSDKRVATELFKLVKYVDNLRFLFLSATPMYNSYKEIIWLLNIMNLNDRRSQIELKDVFDKQGNLLVSPDGTNIGEELIKRKATGYVSFVRGENPYSFPYRIFPSLFSIQHTFKELAYPRKQLNGKIIIQPLEHVDVYVNIAGSYQQQVYNYIIDEIKEKATKSKHGLPSFENLDSFGYTLLQKPLLSLNMVYPNESFSPTSKINSKLLLGTEGLKKIMKYTETTTPPTRKNFEYKSSNFGNIFAPQNIGLYSSKIKNTIDNVINSEGIVLIYSQFIDGGCVPMALALEEMGFTRFGTKTANLFKTAPHKPIDAITFKTKDEMENPDDFKKATYTMITGEKALSLDKVYDLKNLTDEDNKNGEKIKVVIISMTGSEGIDFKNLRQIHILEPWYNLSLIEQVLGRAVRNWSHKQLPFKKRNVEIFLYGTLFSNSDEEAADLYIYRLAEMKAVQIGHVSRILKESSVDCLLNIEQTNFTEENMNTIVPQELSNKTTIQFPVGDKPNTVSCDYMETCNFKCKPFKELKSDDIKLDTYNETFIFMNTDKIIQRIKELFKKKFFFKKNLLISEINILKNYPLIQINAALSILIDDKNEFISDRFNRLGHLINIGEYYLFQPIELNDKNISVFDRRNPIDYKHKQVIYPIDKTDLKINIKSKITKTVGNNPIIQQLQNKYNAALEVNTSINRGEENWYKYASYLHSSNYLIDNFGITSNNYKEFILDSIIELLSFEDTNNLLDYLFFSPINTDFELQLKSYYEKQLLKYKNIIGLIIPKENKQHLLVKSNEKWVNGQQEDYVDLASKIKNKIIKVADINQYVGFIGDFKNEYNIFKVKNLNDKRSKGARCDQSGKSEAIKLLNHILEEDKFTTNNTKGRNKKEFCIIQELLLRYFNKEKKNNKIWFLNPQESIINNIEKMSF
jgi:hypothetical protein